MSARVPRANTKCLLCKQRLGNTHTSPVTPEMRDFIFDRDGALPSDPDFADMLVHHDTCRRAFVRTTLGMCSSNLCCSLCCGLSPVIFSYLVARLKKNGHLTIFSNSYVLSFLLRFSSLVPFVFSWLFHHTCSSSPACCRCAHPITAAPSARRGARSPSRGPCCCLPCRRSCHGSPRRATRGHTLAVGDTAR